MTATKISFESVEQNAKAMDIAIEQLDAEFAILSNEYITLRAQQLREENKTLSESIEQAKNRLIKLERRQGVEQVPLPNQPTKVDNIVVVDSVNLVSLTNTSSNVLRATNEEKPKKEKRFKETKQKLPVSEEPSVDIGRLDLRIGRVQDIQKHPDADSLYVLKINCGEDKSRTVCSGLVKHVPLHDLQDRDVLLLCNLKPVKMRGITSEAMVMCASSSDTVEVLSPPPGCLMGELVNCEGYHRNPDAVLNPKKKIFEAVAPDLATNDMLQACYKGVPLNVPGKGYIVANTLKCCPVK